MKKELWLFTRQFPEGRGEAFLESALPVWCSMFERVRIFPMFRGPGGVTLPAGVEVCHLWDDMHRTVPPLRTLAALPQVLRTMVDRGGTWRMDLSTAQEAFSHARQLRFRSDRVERFMAGHDLDRIALLSVWMEDWVSVLGGVRVGGRAIPFSTMAHGWDLYAHRRPSGSIAYRAAQLEQVAQVLCISEHGASYLRQHHPRHAHKVRVGHLGTTDHGLAPWAPARELRLLSSAYLRPPKRMDRLIEALHLIDRPVHWVHYGDGPDLASLQERARELPLHVRVDWRGAVANDQVIDHFRREPVDLFVLFSDDEGVPVSLMEATSFGVPVVANDVGGVREVVSPRSGLLVPCGTAPHELAAAIVHAADRFTADPSFRVDARRYWEAHFSASLNYRTLAECI
jgi:glycosyltransferase involved in cell wall biosynthesis